MTNDCYKKPTSSELRALARREADRASPTGTELVKKALEGDESAMRACAAKLAGNPAPFDTCDHTYVRKDAVAGGHLETCRECGATRLTTNGETGQWRRGMCFPRRRIWPLEDA